MKEQRMLTSETLATLKQKVDEYLGNGWFVYRLGGSASGDRNGKVWGAFWAVMERGRDENIVEVPDWLGVYAGDELLPVNEDSYAKDSCAKDVYATGWRPCIDPQE